MTCEGCDDNGLIIDTDPMSGAAIPMVCPYCFGRKAPAMRFEVGKWYRPKRELRMAHDRSLAFSPKKAYRCNDKCGSVPYESYMFRSECEMGSDSIHYIADIAGGWFDEFVEASTEDVARTLLISEM